MDKRQRSIMRFSIGLNILLVALVVWGHLKVNFIEDEILFTKIQYTFVKLEGVIEKQSNHGWTEPNRVADQLNAARSGVWVAILKSGTLSHDDKLMFQRLYSTLGNVFPASDEEGDRDIVLTEQEKQNFEKLREILHDVGLGSNVQLSDSRNSMLKQVAELERKLGSL
ncbi:hypothetical protein BEP19_02510 [Ammoniphilus oxalaticus]|uniref:Uncharacterized protein n=1 Tax=Ammoniphilus oxalaticus TaxID=66863 RepID=A0A419SNI7_9BACL|nr:hypothetical protein [Ammoniphilus oxalaticus]RKD25827.1 hypothetical protein BEP19_02510 [Ammoniphilus oxalaticus]